MSDKTNQSLPMTSRDALGGSKASPQVAQTIAPKVIGEGRAIIYRSDAMKDLMSMVDRVAPTQANILVLGESGTGKELIARAIHDRSPRRNRPFVAINCGALRETLLESELFGHEKGAFTGAYTRKIGLAEAAEGGTLFLDEVGEMTPSIQAKLLRFIQEGEIYRVGGKEPIKVDIRLICATNRELETEVQTGRFREDLFYRINTIVLTTPPLRRRKEDIPALIEHFLKQQQHYGVGIKTKAVSDDAMVELMSYEWPGNIRELQNICERMQILAEGHMIMPNDLPEHVRNPSRDNIKLDYDPTITLADLEKHYILRAIIHYNGNKTKAAEKLGITIKTLYNKLHDYGVFEKFAVHTGTKKEVPVETQAGEASEASKPIPN